MNTSARAITVRLEVPRKLQPFLKPMRYKVARGGRGGAKSHFFAEQIVLACYVRTTRVVCIREVQKSIKDSVKQLIVDKIEKLGLGAFFDVQDQLIKGIGPCDGSLIVFRGMQSYNAETIKSLEGFDIAWVEEAQTLSEHSLDMLRPTLRKEGSEIWFSYNPRYKTDPVDKFFMKSPPDNSTVITINWSDNPWFPDVLRKEMEQDFARDPDKAEHIWNGAYGSGKGAIIARQFHMAEASGRVTNGVEYDPNGAPIEISSDIGFRDTATFWFWQRKVGGFSVIKAHGASGWDAADWIIWLQETLTQMGVVPHSLGKIWLPHDARAKTFQSKYSTMERFITAFGMDKIGIVPQSRKSDRIEAARVIIHQCEFHKDDCLNGTDGLVAWEYEFNEETQTFSKEPLHNWASHWGDGYSYGCQVMQGLPDTSYEDEPRHMIIDSELSGYTINDMWNQNSAQKDDRI